MNKRIIMLAALALAAVACGDDSGEAGPGPVIKSDSSVPNTTIDAGGIDSSTPPQGDGGSAGDSGSTDIPKGAPGCYAGDRKTATSKQLLNYCSEGYLVFDNKARLPSTYVNGQLPPLNN